MLGTTIKYEHFKIKTLGTITTYIFLQMSYCLPMCLKILQNYQLDPAHYYTSPSFSGNACLKYTKVIFELLTDPYMYVFMESGIRGGVSTITHRYAKANNRLIKNYNAHLPSSYIIYLDTNNLYGTTMICPRPLGNFTWIEDVKYIENVPDDSEKGYILEVDLEYSDHLLTIRWLQSGSK